MPKTKTKTKIGRPSTRTKYQEDQIFKILSIGSGPCDLEAILSNLGYNITAIDDLNDSWHLISNNKERIKNYLSEQIEINK